MFNAYYFNKRYGIAGSVDGLSSVASPSRISLRRRLPWRRYAA